MRFGNYEPFHGDCYTCGKFGHRKSDCPERNDDDDRRPFRRSSPPKRYSPYPSRRHDEYQRDRSFRQQRSDPDRRDRYHGRYERHERQTRQDHEDRNYNRHERYKPDFDERGELDESYEDYRREREERKNKVKSAKKTKIDRSDVGTCLERYVHYKEDEKVMGTGDTANDKHKKTKKKSNRKITIIDEKEPNAQSLVSADFVMQILLEKVFGNTQDDEGKNRMEYEKMREFFTNRVGKVCQLDVKDSSDIANAMMKACQVAFPKYADLKTRFVEASQKELLTNPGKFPELLDFRQSLHVQLRTKTEKKDNFRFSEVVDLIICYFSSKSVDA
eukprot:08577.XXX_88357_89994_1 [CDS] Oithona nana genome sequencing.